MPKIIFWSTYTYTLTHVVFKYLHIHTKSAEGKHMSWNYNDSTGETEAGGSLGSTG